MEEDNINNSSCVKIICVDPSSSQARGVLYVPLVGGMLVGLLVLGYDKYSE